MLETIQRTSGEFLGRRADPSSLTTSCREVRAKEGREAPAQKRFASKAHGVSLSLKGGWPKAVPQTASLSAPILVATDRFARFLGVSA